LILIVSGSDDEVAQAIQAELRRGDHPSHLLDFRCFPHRDGVAYALSSDGHVSRSYWLDGMEICLDTVTSILWRRPAKAKASSSLEDRRITQYVETSSEEVLEGFFDDLDCLQVPASRRVLKHAHAKIPQLTLAAQLGFRLPATLITNDPDEFLHFYRRHEGQVITKTASVRAESWLGPMGTGYARVVRPRDLVHFRDVQLCPLIVQVYVKKALEVRVTIVGGDVFAAEIHSQATRRTCVDWRRYDRTNTPHHVHELPPDIAELCVSLVRAMGLVYGAIDLILTPDGQYVFLEINPNGQYRWIEKLTGLPITSRIVRLLVEHT
jgi:hypothetical protein